MYLFYFETLCQLTKEIKQDELFIQAFNPKRSKVLIIVYSRNLSPKVNYKFKNQFKN